MTPRILLASYPRSGSSLFLSTVLRNYPQAGFEAERRPDAFERAWSELGQPLPESPVFTVSKMHTPKPEPMRDVGCVMMLRDPRQVLYSHWHFSRSKYGWGPSLEFEAWLDWYRPTWLQWHREWLPKLIRQYGDRFRILRFEMVREAGWRSMVTDAVADFLGKTRREAVYWPTWGELQAADSAMWSGVGDRWTELPQASLDALLSHTSGDMRAVEGILRAHGVIPND